MSSATNCEELWKNCGELCRNCGELCRNCGELCRNCGELCRNCGELRRTVQKLGRTAGLRVFGGSSQFRLLSGSDAFIFEFSSDSDAEDEIQEIGSLAKRLKSASGSATECLSRSSLSLPPPPTELLSSIPDAASMKWTDDDHGGRLRSFPHVPGNYALHVYIPVTLPASIQTKLAPYLYKAVSLFPGLKSMDDEDLFANVGLKQGIKLATEFHISLGRTVPIRIHQVDTVVHMLRRKFDSQKWFWVEFGSWEVFVNDERTRSFLSLEVVATGYSEIKKQVSLVDDVYRLHSLPTFYANPRPHISVAWALGDVMGALATVAQDLNAMARNREKTCLWTCPATKVECKIGQKLHSIWTATV